MSAGEAVLDMRQLIALQDRIDVLKNSLEYLNKLEEIEHLKQRLISATESGDVDVPDFVRLLESRAGLPPHLRALVDTYAEKLNAKISEHFKTTFQKVLDEVGWPKIEDANRLDQFNEAFRQLTNLQVSVDKTATELWSVDLLLEPLRRRFVFHFMGRKETNRLDKPEWYLAWALKQVKELSSFFLLHLQPLVSELRPGLDIQFFMIKEFVKLVLRKLETDVILLRDEPALLLHCVDEVCQLQRDLHTLFSYPPMAAAYPVPTGGLVTDAPFVDCWIIEEWNVIAEVLGPLMESGEAWVRQYDQDSQQRITRGAYELASLLTDLQGRISLLPSWPVQRRFLQETELRAVTRFREQIGGHWAQFPRTWTAPTYQAYCPLLNSVQFMLDLLGGWVQESDLKISELQGRNLRVDGEADGDERTVNPFVEPVRQYKEMRREFFARFVTEASDRFLLTPGNYFERNCLYSTQSLQLPREPSGDGTELSQEVLPSLRGLDEALRLVTADISTDLWKKLGRKFAASLDGLVLGKLLRSPAVLPPTAARQLKYDLQGLQLLLDKYIRNSKFHFRLSLEAVELMTRADVHTLTRHLGGSRDSRDPSLLAAGFPKLLNWQA